jgi:hypothetical protein
MRLLWTFLASCLECSMLQDAALHEPAKGTQQASTQSQPQRYQREALRLILAPAAQLINNACRYSHRCSRCCRAQAPSMEHCPPRTPGEHVVQCTPPLDELQLCVVLL